MAGGGQGGAEEVEAPVEGGQEEEQMREIAAIMFPERKTKNFNVSQYTVRTEDKKLVLSVFLQCTVAKELSPSIILTKRSYTL